MSQEQAPERAVQVSVHRYKVAAILLLAPSISGIGVTVPASADEQSVRRGKAIAVTRCSYCHSIEKGRPKPPRRLFEAFTSSTR